MTNYYCNSWDDWMNWGKRNRKIPSDIDWCELSENYRNGGLVERMVAIGVTQTTT